MRLTNPNADLEGDPPDNNRMQAAAGGVAVLSSRVRRSPAAPDAAR